VLEAALAVKGAKRRVAAAAEPKVVRLEDAQSALRVEPVDFCVLRVDGPVDVILLAKDGIDDALALLLGARALALLRLGIFLFERSTLCVASRALRPERRENVVEVVRTACGGDGGGLGHGGDRLTAVSTRRALHAAGRSLRSSAGSQLLYFRVIGVLCFLLWLQGGSGYSRHQLRSVVSRSMYSVRELSLLTLRTFCIDVYILFMLLDAACLADLTTA